MKLLNRLSTFAASVSLGLLALGCSEDSPVSNPPVDNSKPSEIDRSVIAKGADVSWVTKLEAEGERFYSPAGEQMECMELLRDHCGVNAIRLRVWVDPVDGWNNIGDVLVKARRANSLGLRLMIDFHFSDTWADPGNQRPPEAWADFTPRQMADAITAHVTTLMKELRRFGIFPEWVQIGNETTPGMLLPVGDIETNPFNFAAFVDAGYEAVKAVFPQSKVIVHLDKGNDRWRYDRALGVLRDYCGRYDVVGMSLYPSADNWDDYARQMAENVAHINSTYGKAVMLCEVGMHHSEGAICKNLISQIFELNDSNDFLGIFYWEPEAPSGYNGGYRKGCFENGTPTEALDPFKLY